MVLAAALISLAVLAPQAPAQAPAQAPGQAPAQATPQAGSQAKVQTETQPASPDDSKPYSVDSVRRAATSGARPPTGYTPVERAGRGYRATLDSRAIHPDPCSLIITACQPAWRGGANPTWHDQFIAMTGPPSYTVPYSGMSNSQTLQAVASSIAINLAIQAVASLIHDEIVKVRYDRKQRKLEKVRTEIRAEVAELERLNAAARASGQIAVR